MKTKRIIQKHALEAENDLVMYDVCNDYSLSPVENEMQFCCFCGRSLIQNGWREK